MIIDLSEIEELGFKLRGSARSWARWRSDYFLLQVNYYPRLTWFVNKSAIWYEVCITDIGDLRDLLESGLDDLLVVE